MLSIKCDAPYPPYIGPILCTIVVAFYVYLEISGGDVDGQNPPKEALLAWAFVGVMLLTHGLVRRFRKISVDKDNLYISNYFLKEISVPLTDIAAVSEESLPNGHILTIHLKHPSRFGDKIRFLPALRNERFYSRYPIADELMELATAKRRPNDNDRTR